MFPQPMYYRSSSNNKMIFVVAAAVVIVIVISMSNSSDTDDTKPDDTKPDVPPKTDSVDMNAVRELAAKYDGMVIRCDTTGSIWFVEDGKKRYIDGVNWSRVSHVGPNNVTCDVAAAIPDGPPAVLDAPPGNSGAVNCATFIGGKWLGASAYPAANPTWLGARALTSTPVSTAGRCPMIYTNNPKFAFSRRVTGNDGTATCQQYCQGKWGRGLLKSVWPDAPGARAATGSNSTAEGPDGECWCAPSYLKTHEWPA
jgi:hypothetical protein